LVDETTVRLFETPRYHWRYPTSRPTPIYETSKYRQKVNIWGGISYKGPTMFAIFQENMNSALYAQILEEFCIQFIIRNNKHASDMVSHQDNDT